MEKLKAKWGKFVVWCGNHPEAAAIVIVVNAIAALGWALAYLAK